MWVTLCLWIYFCGEKTGLKMRLAGIRSQQLSHSGIDERGVHGVGATAREVPPHTRNHPQLGVRHVADRPCLILRREVEVLLRRHDQCLRPDGAESLLHRTEPRRTADITAPPGVQHGDQVVRVPTVQEEPFPE